MATERGAKSRVPIMRQAHCTRIASPDMAHNLAGIAEALAIAQETGLAEGTLFGFFKALQNTVEKLRELEERLLEAYSAGREKAKEAAAQMGASV